MGSIWFASCATVCSVAKYAVDAGDRRLRTSGLRPAIWSIWRPAVDRRIWIWLGRAAAGLGPAVGWLTTASAFATGRERGGASVGARPTSDPGAGTEPPPAHPLRPLPPAPVPPTPP